MEYQARSPVKDQWQIRSGNSIKGRELLSRWHEGSTYGVLMKAFITLGDKVFVYMRYELSVNDKRGFCQTYRENDEKAKRKDLRLARHHVSH